MKKYVLIFAAALALSSTATMAQKVDVDGLTSKMEKCDSDTTNPKKGAKAATWISRGDAYLNSIIEPTKALFTGMDAAMMELSCGAASSKGTAQFKGAECETFVYPFFTAYVQGGKVVGWSENKVVRDGALDVALESYNKAVEIDSNAGNKIKSSVESAINYYKNRGNIDIDLGNMAQGADAFIIASDLTELPYYSGKPEATLLFYAGYMLAIDGEKNPESHVKGEAVLKKALDAGYQAIEDANSEMEDSSRGNIYYYAYCCAYGQREGNSEKLQDAKAFLVEGVEKYPANERIFEGLMQLYTVEEGMGDPAELLAPVDEQIAKDPSNQNAWFSRGRIYYAMKNYDECISSFLKVVELNPTFFEGNFYLGLFYMLKADSMLEEINAATYTDQSKYNADLEGLNDAYALAIPYFEAAHEIKPTDRGALESLKQLCFRLRDMPGIMDKYTKYNGLLQNLAE